MLHTNRTDLSRRIECAARPWRGVSMSGTSYRRHVAFVLALYGLSLSRVMAQQSAPPGDADHTARLEEVIVTAQKRSEDLQSVPISVQVVNSQTLAEQNFNSVNS